MMATMVRADRWVRSFIPAIVTFALLTITILPLGLGALPYLQVSLLLIGIVYWSLRTPAQFPLWLVFAFGVLADLVELTPLGLQALLFMAVPLLVRGRRRVLALHSFPVLWLIFAAAVLAQITLFWLVALAGSGMAPAGGGTVPAGAGFDPLLPAAGKAGAGAGREAGTWLTMTSRARVSSPRRALMLGAAQLALAGTLAGRMYYLQVLTSDRYKMLAETNRINARLLAPGARPNRRPFRHSHGAEPAETSSC